MSDISLTYEFLAWHIIILCVLLIIISVFEWKLKKRNRILRIFAVSIALISLYIIYLKPVISIDKPTKSIVLIGKNISNSLSDYLVKFSEYEVLFWDENTHLLKSKNQKRTYSFSQLDYAIDTLFVRGYVPPINPAYYQHLVMADTVSRKYSIDFPDKIYLGDTISLKITNKSDENIIVEGQLGNDSIKNEVLKSDQDYFLNYIPTTSGFHQSVVLIDEEEEYNFSTLVEDKRKYVFHLLAETPDFEWRFLKDFLAKEGHAIYLRSKVSSKKYKTDFVNWPDSLSAQMKTFNPLYSNVLIIDMEAWNKIGNSGRTNYLSLLNEKQGVLLLRANSNERLNLNSIESDLNGYVIVGESSNEYEGLKMASINKQRDFDQHKELPFFFTILTDLSIGITPMQDTYKWQLAGKESIYSNYWIKIINQLLRDPAERYQDKTQWPVQFQPFHFQLWTSTDFDKVKVVNNKSDTINIGLIQDKHYPERRHLVYYPVSTGWHQIISQNKTIIDQFYVHPEEASAQNLMDLSYKFEYNNYFNEISSTEQFKSSNNKVKSLILWFFLLFLLSISFLWVEEKV